MLSVCAALSYTPSYMLISAKLIHIHTCYDVDCNVVSLQSTICYYLAGHGGSRRGVAQGQGALQVSQPCRKACFIAWGGGGGGVSKEGHDSVWLGCSDK